MAIKVLTFDLEGNGPHDLTQQAMLTAVAPFDATVEVWGAGDIYATNEDIVVYFGGDVFAANLNASQRQTPIPTLREDAEKLHEDTWTFNSATPDVRVTGTQYVDQIDNGLAARVWVVLRYDAVGMEPDFYKDFSYARITQTVGVSDETIFVDDTSRFPSNEILAKSVFLMTIESDLTQGAFEIVRVSSVDEVNQTIDVIRGMEDTEPQPHPAYVVIKGAVTAGMMRRVRGVYVKDEIPSPDPDVYFDGDVLFDQENEIAFILAGGEWIAFTAGVARQVAKLAASVAQIAGDVAAIQDTLYEPPSTQIALMRIATHLTTVMEWESTILDHSRIVTRMGLELAGNEVAIQQLQDDVTTLQSGLDATTASIALGG